MENQLQFIIMTKNGMIENFKTNGVFNHIKNKKKW